MLATVAGPRKYRFLTADYTHLPILSGEKTEDYDSVVVLKNGMYLARILGGNSYRYILPNGDFSAIYDYASEFDKDGFAIVCSGEEYYFIDKNFKSVGEKFSSYSECLKSREKPRKSPSKKTPSKDAIPVKEDVAKDVPTDVVSIEPSSIAKKFDGREYFFVKSDGTKSNSYKFVMDFRDGIAIVQVGCEWYCIDEEFKTISKKYKNSIEVIKERSRLIRLSLSKETMPDEKPSEISGIKEEANKPQYVGVSSEKHVDSINEPVESLKIYRSKVNGLYYYQTSDGSLYGEGYLMAKEFKDGLAMVRKADRRWYFIDKNLNAIHSEGFKKVYNFQDGVAIVQSANDEMFYFLSQDGEIISKGYESFPYLDIVMAG